MTEWLGPISKLVKHIGSCIPVLLKWYYTEKKLDSLVLMDISASGQGVSYYFASQDCQCWLMVTNLSPFDLTLERLRVTISVDGGSFTCELTVPEQIKGGSQKRVFVKGKSPVPEMAGPLMKAARKAYVEIESYAATPVRKFPLRRSITDMRNLEIF